MLALGFDTKQRNSFFDQIWCVFYNKSKILTILLIVKYEKITLFDEFLVLLGPIISSFFACSNEEKINKNNKGCLLYSYLYDSNVDNRSKCPWQRVPTARRGSGWESTGRAAGNRPGPNVIKLFPVGMLNKARVFVLGRPFQTSRMLVVKARYLT